jgi:hypothetical protein
MMNPTSMAALKADFFMAQGSAKADLLDALAHFGTKISMEPAEPAAFGLFCESVIVRCGGEHIVSGQR